MANKITQLVNKDGDNLYPLAGGILSDSVTTDMLQDESVTSDKIDWSTTQHFSSYISDVVNVTINSGGGLIRHFSEFFGGTTAFNQMMNGKAIAAANVFISGPGSTGDILTKMMVSSSQFDSWSAYGFGIKNVGEDTRTVGCKVFLVLVDV